MPAISAARSNDATSSIATPFTCATLSDGEIIVSRTTLVVAITICIFITCLSILGLTALLYRECARRRQAKMAKTWGRKSTYDNRISQMRKEIDLQFTRQYSGCLHNEPENPEMGTDSPVELMYEERVWEVPAVPAKAAINKDKRKSKLSLFFDDAVGLWCPKR